MYFLATLTPKQTTSLPKDLQQEVIELKQDTQQFTLDLGTQRAVLEQHGISSTFLLQDDKKLFHIVEQELAKQAQKASDIPPSNVATISPADKKINLQKAIKGLQILVSLTAELDKKIKLGKAIKGLQILLQLS